MVPGQRDERRVPWLVCGVAGGGVRGTKIFL